MRSRLPRLLLVAALALPVTIALTGEALAAGHGASVVYLAKRHGLNVRIAIRGSWIVAITAGAALRCQDGTRSGGFEVSDVDLAIPIGRDGRFRAGESESIEGAGSESWHLRGRLAHGRIVGTWSASEEESHLPSAVRCGTRMPRGLPLAFVAHRITVAGGG